MMNDSPAPQEIFLLKLGEVVLKGLNRQSFEDKLLANVRRRVKNCGSFQCSLRQSTIYVEPQSDDCDMEAAWTACRQVFGIAAVARAVPCEKTVPAIVEAARTYLADAFAAAKSFKVESKRADKTYPMNSIQLSQAVGGDLAELFPNVAVDVHHPDLTVFVEIREKYAYVHTPSIPGAGGLPIGMGGRAVSLLSGGIDSPVSSWMMARRGVELEMVHFVSPPYTSQQAQDKVLELARLLTAWTGRLLVHIVPFTKIQEEIRKNCPEEFFIAFIKLIAAFAILCTMNVWLTLIIFMILPFMLVCSSHFNHKLREAFKAQRHQIGELNAQVEDSLLGVRRQPALENECCACAALRAAFLLTGYAADPHSEYRLEFSLREQTMADFVGNLLKSASFPAKGVCRRGQFVVY